MYFWQGANLVSLARDLVLLRYAQVEVPGSWKAVVSCG